MLPQRPRSRRPSTSAARSRELPDGREDEGGVPIWREVLPDSPDERGGSRIESESPLVRGRGARVRYTATSSATDSTCAVCGNRSKERMDSSRYAGAIRLRSRASVAGLQET